MRVISIEEAKKCFAQLCEEVARTGEPIILGGEGEPQVILKLSPTGSSADGSSESRDSTKLQETPARRDARPSM